MPSCFWNFLSRSLVLDTLRQPTSKHTLTFRETRFFPLPQLTPLLLSSPSLSCREFNLLDQAPHYRSSTSCLAPDRIVWGILGSSCADVWLCMWRLVQFWHLLLLCDEVGQRNYIAVGPLRLCINKQWGYLDLWRYTGVYERSFANI